MKQESTTTANTGPYTVPLGARAHASKVGSSRARLAAIRAKLRAALADKKKVHPW